MRLFFRLQETGVDSGLFLLLQDLRPLEPEASAGALGTPPGWVPHGCQPVPLGSSGLLLQSLEWLPMWQAPETGGGRDRTLDLSRLPMFLGGAKS